MYKNYRKASLLKSVKLQGGTRQWTVKFWELNCDKLFPNLIYKFILQGLILFIIIG